jgi:hypothetical protein
MKPEYCIRQKIVRAARLGNAAFENFCLFVVWRHRELGATISASEFAQLDSETT